VTNGWIVEQWAEDLRIMRLWKEQVYVQEAVLTRRFKCLWVDEQHKCHSGLYLPIPSVTNICFP